MKIWAYDAVQLEDVKALLQAHLETTEASIPLEDTGVEWLLADRAATLKRLQHETGATLLVQRSDPAAGRLTAQGVKFPRLLIEGISAEVQEAQRLVEEGLGNGGVPGVLHPPISEPRQVQEGETMAPSAVPIPEFGRLYVKHIPATTSAEELRSMFTQFGTLLEFALRKPNRPRKAGGGVAASHDLEAYIDRIHSYCSRASIVDAKS